MPALLLFSSNVYPQSRYKVLTTPGGGSNLGNFQQSAEDRTTNCFNLQLHIFVFGVFRCSLTIEHFVSLPLRGRGSETYFTEQPTATNTDGHNALRPSYNVVTDSYGPE